jgi:3-dehydroquinate dehydratase type I
LTIRICVSILPKTITEACHLIEKAEDAEADLIEVRIDNLKDISEWADLSDKGKVPKIATNKKADMAIVDSQKALLQAAKSGFEYVDIDLHTPNLKETVKELTDLGAKSIVSFHDSNGSLSTSRLETIFAKQLENNPEICKIVATAKKLEDNLTLLDFVSKVSHKAKIVCFAMGEHGKISRLLSPVFGGFFTFASLETGSETAPGQMTIQEMKTAYALLGLKTK